MSAPLSKWMKVVLALAVVMLVAVAMAGVGLACGWWRLTTPDVSRFPVWGVDVSHHQGEINWAALASEPRIAFAYVKATEGAAWKDPRFRQNWEATRKEGLRVGAYHFFTFCRPASQQAANFLAVVPNVPDALPPALDVEFGGNCRREPERSSVVAEVNEWLMLVERSRGVRPVLYVTPEAYDAFFADRTVEHAFWIRSLFGEPRMNGASRWQFWQFANRARLRGVSTFVDLNAFSGDRAAPLRCQRHSTSPIKACRNSARTRSRESPFSEPTHPRRVSSASS